MNFKSKLATLAVLGTIGMSAVAGATTVGVVNVGQAYNAYPGFGAVQMQVKKVQEQYVPQLQKEQQKIEALKDKAAQEKEAQANYVPLLKQYQEAMAKVVGPMDQKLGKALENVIATKKADLVVLDPAALNAMVFEPNSKVVDVTADVVAQMK